MTRGFASNLFTALLLIGVVLGASYIGYVGVTTVYNSFRYYVARLTRASTQPFHSGNGTDCWTISQDGLNLQATLGSGSYNTSRVMIVDTGAFISAAPAELASSLNVQLVNDRQVTLGSVYGQSQTGWIHTISLSISGMSTVQIPIAIMESNSVPYVLGRQGFLDLFDLRVQQSSGIFCLTQH